MHTPTIWSAIALLVACSGPDVPAPMQPAAQKDSQETHTATSPPEPPVTASPTSNLIVDEAKSVSLGGYTFAISAFITAEIPDEGGSAELVLKVGDEAHDFTYRDDPKQSKMVVWRDDLRIELIEANDAARGGEFLVQRITDQRLPNPRVGVRLDRRTKVALDEEWEIEFRGHSHKMVSPGQSSPLMVAVRYWHGTQWDSANFNLHPPEHRTWRWRDYEFELENHDYDKFMDVSIHRLQLAVLE
jgi:hypothetical protein